MKSQTTAKLEKIIQILAKREISKILDSKSASINKVEIAAQKDDPQYLIGEIRDRMVNVFVLASHFVDSKTLEKLRKERKELFDLLDKVYYNLPSSY